MHGVGSSQRKNILMETKRDSKVRRSTHFSVHVGGAPMLSTIIKGVQLTSNALFGPVGAKVSNALSKRFGKNPEARDVFPGEKHIILPTKHGLTRANFAGPGTQVEKRVKRGDRGVDGARGIDAIARRHDLAYVAARTKEDIRVADDTMIADVRRSSAGSKTKAIVMAALKAKKLGEDLKIFDVNTFTQVIEDDNVPGAAGQGGALPADRMTKRMMASIQIEPRPLPQTRRGATTGSGHGARVGGGFVQSLILQAVKQFGPKVAQLLIPIIIAKLQKSFGNKSKLNRKRKRSQ